MNRLVFTKRVRHAWKLNPEKAQLAKFVLAIQQGLIIGVFVAEQWLEATEESFPSKEELIGRYGFISHEAPDEIQKLYLRISLPDHMRKRGAANPLSIIFNLVYPNRRDFIITLTGAR